MAQSLYLAFTQGDKTRTVTIANPKSNLKKAEVEAAMNVIIEAKALNTNGAVTDGIKECYYRETVKTELED